MCFFFLLSALGQTEVGLNYGLEQGATNMVLSKFSWTTNPMIPDHWECWLVDESCSSRTSGGSTLAAPSLEKQTKLSVLLNQG